jgi:hypothetical protein
MMRILFYYIMLLTVTTQTLGMRTACMRPHSARQSIRMSAPRAAINRIPSRHYSSDTHSSNQQKAWAAMDADVSEKIKEWKTKAAKHHALSSQHIKHARACAALAELEREKLNLFKLAIEEINEATRYPVELPDFEKMTRHMELLTQSYEHFMTDLPEDEKA